MTHKDLYEYIRQEIINELSEGSTKTFIASSSSDEENAIAADSSISSTAKVAAKKALQGSKPGASVVVPTNEMANLPSTIVVGDSDKIKLAKELYEGSTTEKVIDAVVNAGEEGITQEKLSEILGIRFSLLTQPIKDLTKIGAFSKSRPTVKPTKTAKVDDTKVDDVEDNEVSDDELTPITPKKEPEEEKPEEPEPEQLKPSNKDDEKLVSKSNAKKLSDEEELKYKKLVTGIEAKVAKILALPKEERGTSGEMNLLKQIISRDDVKKLFKAKNSVSISDLTREIF